MKKNILQNLKFIAFGLVLAAGISVAYAGIWSEPAGAAPASNVAVPLHSGPTQVKTGGLSVGPFAAGQNGQFDQQIFVNGMLRGSDATQANSQVKFGDTAHTVNATVTGNASAVGALKSSGIANSQSGALCAAKDGTIVVCGAAEVQAENYSVPAQVLVYPMPDYAYTSGGPRYIPSLCLSSTAFRNLNFLVKYTEDTGTSRSVIMTVRTGQMCADRTSSNVVLSAPHTIVKDATGKCTYEGNDTNYQSPAYQGYSVTVDPSLQCAH